MHLIHVMLALVNAPASFGGDGRIVAAAVRLPQVVLRQEYHPICRRPCELIGFSFAGPKDELLEMRAAGANTVGLGAMWRPVPDDGAPYGCGAQPPGGAGVLAQVFTAEAPFDGAAARLPTGHSTDSGCRWTLFRTQGSKLRAERIATGQWTDHKDNAWAEARFAEQPPGRYCLELSQPSGTWIGWWATRGDAYPDGHAVVAGKPDRSIDFHLRLHTRGQWRDLVPRQGKPRAVHLGPLPTRLIETLGLNADYSVGNWNNPGFPYYPDWFWQRFADAAALDQHGKPILGGMFGKLVPAPGIEHPAIVTGTSRFIVETVRQLRSERALRYWVMGGEAMYATYSYKDRWTDYSPNAIRHFRAWLASRRYGHDIDALNRAWRRRYADFEQVVPPTQPTESRRWLDWLDFRFEAMGERFGWHYQAIRSEDPDRLILTCNHGTLYHGLSYAQMGARPEIYAAESDGFETGQIMQDGDPDLYNLLYGQTLTSLGKPYCPRRLAYKKSDPHARGGGTSFTPQAARRYSYESLGLGAWHLGLIQWSGSLPDGEWGVRGTPAEKEIAKIFGEIRQLWPLLEDMHAVRPTVAVFLSHPTWALRGFLPAWQALHVAAVERQVPKLYVYDGQVLSGEVREYPILLSLDNALLATGIPEALLGYVRGGGKLIIAGAFGTGCEGLGSPIPQELRGSGTRRIGKGQIVTLPATEPEAVLAAIGRSAVPVAISGGPDALRERETRIAEGYHDWPQDLHGHDSLGQTIRLPHDGLSRVAVRMPTYLNKPPTGFVFELRVGGPGGRVLASRSVPAGIGDNTWVDMPVPESPPAGQIVYVRLVPDPALPKQHLGWWSTRQDVYPDGQAYVDDKPVAGDRQVRLTFRQRIEAGRAVESFVLSDGLNFGVVLINVGLNRIRPRIDLSGLPYPLPADDYRVTSPLEPGQWNGAGQAGTVRLEPGATAFLYVQRQTNEDEARQAVAAARRRARRHARAGGLTPFAAYALERASDLLAQGRYAKAAAMALKVCGQLGLAVQCPNELHSRDRLVLTVRVFDGEGRPCRADRVQAEFVPTPAFSRPLEAVDTGVYRLDLAVADLPPRYDYAAGKYVAFHGPLRIRVAAIAGPLRASRTVSLTIRPQPTGTTRAGDETAAANPPR